MKRFKLLSLPLFFAALTLFSSCGGETKNNGNTADTVAGNKADTPAVAANTIVTSPQGMMLVTHKVTNFQQFMAAYESHDSFRLAYGVHSYVIGRGFNDSNTIFVATKVDDMQKAMDFAKSANLKASMQKAGVAGAPSMMFLTATWQDTATLSGTTLRSKTDFSVKDWAVWEKSFTEGRAERMANGIVDRVYGHDAADNNKVELVTAITDTAKAFAYYKSDELKKRRAAGGVIGEPKRFLFYIVKRY